MSVCLSVMLVRLFATDASQRERIRCQVTVMSILSVSPSDHLYSLQIMGSAQTVRDNKLELSL